MGARNVIVIYDHDNALQNSDGKLTAPVIIICVAVASAGLMFGYETGVYRDVTSMEPFLKKFFPSVDHNMHNVQADQFCLFDRSKLSAYASSLYLAAIFSALLAGRLTTAAGRKGSLIIGGIIYLIGASLHALAENLEMLVLARVLIGFGIGFAFHAAPIYLAEIAPTKWRGAVGTGFPLFFEIGVFTAKWINIYLKEQFANDDRCWRISLGLSGLPATIMAIIAFFIPDTPSSLIQRGKIQEALKSLNQVRSVEVDTETELKYLIHYHETMRSASERPYNMLFERRYRPQVLLAIALPAFRQMTGIHLNGNLGPILFRSVGFHFEESMLVLVIHGTIVILSVLVATYFIDRLGRRFLLLEAGLQIFICQVALAVIMASEMHTSEGPVIFSKRSAIVALFLNVFVNSSFACSWGTVNWILPCEILSMEVRPAGQGLSLAVNFAFQFLITQTAVPMLCNFRYGSFLFFAGWVVIMTLFVVFFVPETTRIPLESMDVIWRSHWYWSRFVDGADSLLKPEGDHRS